MTDTADLWRQARQSISEYEQKSSELALVLQTEKDSLASLQSEVQALQAEKAELLKKAEAAETQAVQGREAAEALAAQGAKATEEGAVLMKHLELYRDSKRKLTTQLELDRQRYQEHISQLALQLEAYRRHFASAAESTAVVVPL